MEKYKLIFSGQLKQGKDQETMGRFLCKFLRISESNCAKLFSGRAYALKSNLDQQQANELHNKLDQAGILTRVIREQSLQEDVTFQDTVVKTPDNHEARAVVDYRISLGDKVLCKHCGTLLTTMSNDMVIHGDASVFNEANSSTSPTQITKQPLNPSSQKIEELGVSSWWQERFKLLQKSGAADLTFKQYFFQSGITQLSSAESRKLTFPLLPMFIALLIGPFIYFFKGMFKKGLFLTFISTIFGIVLMIIAELVGFELKPVLSNIFGMVIVGQLYIYDHFRYRIVGETFWPGLPNWMGSSITASIISSLLIAFIALSVIANLY